MTDKPMPTLPKGILTDEQLQKISGGDCTADDYITIIGDLKNIYDDLVDFTSYVIERVAS